MAGNRQKESELKEIDIMKQFKYMVKIVLREDCENIDEIKALMQQRLGDEMIPLVDGFYGTNEEEEALATSMALANCDKIRENAIELLAYDVLGKKTDGTYAYEIEDLKESWKSWQARRKRKQDLM